MARSKKINTNPMEEIIKSTAQSVKTIEWNGIKIDVKNRLSLMEMSAFVSSASDICFTNSEDYVPEVFEYAISIITLGVYTNLELPQSVDDQYSLVMFTDIIEKVTECIDATEQYANAVNAVKEKIDYRIDTNITAVRNQISEMFSSVEGLLTKLNDTFGTLNNDDVQNLVKSLASNGFDEEKIMQAYLKNKEIKS